MLLWIARDDVRQRTHGAGHSGLRPSHAWRLSYITGLHRAVHPLVHVLCHHAVIAHLSSRGLHSHFRVHVGANGASLRHLMAIVSHAALLEVFLLYLPIVARHERLSAYYVDGLHAARHSTAVYRFVGTSTGLLHHILLCLSSSHQKVCIVSRRVRVAALIGIATYVLASTIYNRPIGMVCDVALNLPRGQAPHVSFGSLAYLMDSA